MTRGRTWDGRPTDQAEPTKSQVKRLAAPTFDEDGYPTEETLQAIHCWPPEDFPGLMAFVKTAWSDYGWFENEPSRIEPVFRGDEDDGHWWCYATGGWSGNESIIAALHDNALFYFMCWQASLRGGYGEYHVRPPSPCTCPGCSDIQYKPDIHAGREYAQKAESRQSGAIDGEIVVSGQHPIENRAIDGR